MRALRRIWANSFEDRPTVNVIKLIGIISEGNSARAINLRLYQSIIDQAFEERPSAVAVVVNSPGGSPVQSALLHDRIRYHADLTKVPVWTFAEDVAASGGYWLMTAGDESYASPASIVGSIGAVLGGFGAHEAIAKLGIERRVLASAPRKVQNDPFSPRKPEDVENVQRILNEMHRIFKNHVMARRGPKITQSVGTAEVDNTIFNGDVFLGHRAKELGLVDEVGDLFEIAVKKLGRRVKLREFRRQVFRFGILPTPGVLVDSALDNILLASEEAALRAQVGL